MRLYMLEGRAGGVHLLYIRRQVTARVRHYMVSYWVELEIM